MTLRHPVDEDDRRTTRITGFDRFDRDTTRPQDGAMAKRERRRADANAVAEGTAEQNFRSITNRDRCTGCARAVVFVYHLDETFRRSDRCDRKRKATGFCR